MITILNIKFALICNKIQDKLQDAMLLLDVKNVIHLEKKVLFLTFQVVPMKCGQCCLQ